MKKYNVTWVNETFNFYFISSIILFYIFPFLCILFYFIFEFICFFSYVRSYLKLFEFTQFCSSLWNLFELFEIFRIQPNLLEFIRTHASLFIFVESFQIYYNLPIFSNLYKFIRIYLKLILFNWNLFISTLIEENTKKMGKIVNYRRFFGCFYLEPHFAPHIWLNRKSVSLKK